MPVLTLIQLIQLIAALAGAAPKLIEVAEYLHSKGATGSTRLTPEQHATVLSAITAMAASLPQEHRDAVVAAMNA